MKNQTILIVSVAVIIFLTYSFIYLDFQFATSSTQANSQVSTYKSDSPTPDINGKIYLYIQPDSALEKKILTDLTSKLENKGAQVEITESIASKFDAQAILIAVQNKSISYNPIFPRASIKLILFYTYNGNTTYFEELVRGEVPVVAFFTTNMIIEGSIELVDSTNGVISMVAYRKHLATNLADETFKKLPWGET